MELAMSKSPEMKALCSQLRSFQIGRQTLSRDEVYGRVLGNLSFVMASSSDRERRIWLEEAAVRCSNLSKLLLHLADYDQRYGRNLVRGVASVRLKQALANFQSEKPQLVGPRVDCGPDVIEICTALAEWFKPITGLTLEVEAVGPVFLAPRARQALVLICVNMVLNAASASLGGSYRRRLGIALSRGYHATVTLTLTDSGLEAASFPASPIFGIIANLLSLLDCEACVRATQCGGLRLTIDLQADCDCSVNSGEDQIIEATRPCGLKPQGQV